MHILAGSLERRLVCEIPGFDDQGVALPAAGRASHPLADVFRQTRTPVGRDDADVMDHLDENHHVSGRLHDLIVVVVGPGKHGRPVAVHDDAAHAQRLVLYGVGCAPHSLSRLCALGGSLLSLR